MRRSERDELGPLRDAIKQQTHALMIIHCNERFYSLNQLKNKKNLDAAMIEQSSYLQRVGEQKRHDKGEPTPPDIKSLDQVVEYFLTYWLLQWDQHMFYQNGLLPKWAYKMWLTQRWENYNLSSSYTYTLPDKKMTTSDNKELRAIQSQEALFRYGWDRAKAFYAPLKPGFVLFATRLDAIMKTSTLPDAAQEIQTYFGTDFSLEKD